MAKKKIAKTDVVWQNVVYRHYFYKDSGKGAEEMALRCENYGEEDEKWVDSAFHNRLLSSSPHMFTTTHEAVL